MRILCFGWLCVFFGHKWYISSCALCCVPRLRITKLSFNIPERGTHVQTEGNIMQFFECEAAPKKIFQRNIDMGGKYPNSLQLSSFSMVDEPTTTDDDSQSDIKKLLISWIRWYRNTLSPIMPPNCRFLPSCSNYAIQAIDEQGSYRQVAIYIGYLMNAI
jgi:Putative membrane protein insertion efficiency factor